MRTIIICIIGESGSGKTYIADILEKSFQIPMIESRTTRPRRSKEETGHLFVSDDEFNEYKTSDMIAFTEFGGKRYCCLIEDVDQPIMSYVIDEYGLLYLKEHFSDKFDIFAVRVSADWTVRKDHVSAEREARDEGQFTLTEEFFDHFIDNRYNDIDLYRKITKMILRVSQKYFL